MPEAGRKIEWLVKAPGSEPSPDVVELCTDEGHFRVERLEPSDGISAYLSTGDIRHELQIDARRGAPEARLYGFVGLRGQVGVHLTDGAAVTISPAIAPLYVPALDRGVMVMEPQSDLRHAGYAIRLDRVRQMLGGEVPDRLVAFMAGEGHTRAVEVRTTRRLRHLAVSLASAHLRGPLRLIYVEGVILQLFATHAASAGLLAEQLPRQLSARERDAIEGARSRLLADMANPPGLTELAAEAGLGAKALNAGFRSLYGRTVYEVLRDERLDHARMAIEAGGLTIREIAARVGYGHVSNFTSAFSRRFGAPPRRFQKSRHPHPTAGGPAEAGDCA